MKHKIKFSNQIQEKVPQLKVVQIEAEVQNPPTSDGLWDEILAASDSLASEYELSELNKRPSIAANRKAYKILGKDPNRYRPSAEALGRRVINGKGIYRLTTLIDVINLISIETGYSIGGFDADKIQGEEIELGVGIVDEEFNAIGRGRLNIEGLPVYRDKAGGIGTPTSDEERTKLTPETKRLLMLVNIYGEEQPAEKVTERIKELLTKYAGLQKFEEKILTVSSN